MRSNNPNDGLLARARAAGRLPADQGRLEQQASQQGYELGMSGKPFPECFVPVDETLGERIRAGYDLGVRIRGIQGKMLDIPTQVN